MLTKRFNILLLILATTPISSALADSTIHHMAALVVERTAAHTTKTRTVKGHGVTVTIAGDWVTVDGKPAALEEQTAQARAFSQGLFTVIIYQSGKVQLMQSGVYVGELK